MKNQVIGNSLSRACAVSCLILMAVLLSACERNKFALAEVDKPEETMVEYSHKVDRDVPVRGH